MKISIGSDHHGLEHRKTIAAAITELGESPVDLGTNSNEPCDYPDIAFAVANSVVSGETRFGILVCGTGIGMSIAANKVAHIRAAVCHDQNTAELSRQHNDANVLCLPGKSLDAEQMTAIVKLWLRTDFEAGRHARRVDKIVAFEDHTNAMPS